MAGVDDTCSPDRGLCMPPLPVPWQFSHFIAVGAVMWPMERLMVSEEASGALTDTYSIPALSRQHTLSDAHNLSPYVLPVMGRSVPSRTPERRRSATTSGCSSSGASRTRGPSSTSRRT